MSGLVDNTTSIQENQSHTMFNMLEPENRLLDKFQQALKDHLLKSIEQFKDSIFDDELALKKTEAQNNDLGIQIYELQQMKTNQERSLQNSLKRLEDMSITNENIADQLFRTKQDLKTYEEHLSNAQKLEHQVENDVESTNFLLQQMRKWENTLESEMLIKQRISEKTRKEKQLLSDLNRKQDILIYNMMKRIWSIQQELQTINTQLKIKRKEQKDVAQTIISGNITIDSLETEHRNLIQSWNSVVVAINNRDNILHCLRSEAVRQCEDKKTVDTEIEHVKKVCRKAMEQNENLNTLKHRLTIEIERNRHKVTDEQNQKHILNNEISIVHGTINDMEEDIKQISEQNQDTRNLISNLHKESNKLEMKRNLIEDNIFKHLSSQMASDRAVLDVNRSIYDVKQQTKNIEVVLEHCQNKNAGLQLERESQVLHNEQCEKYLKKLDEDLRGFELEASSLAEEGRKLEVLNSKKLREMDLLTVQLYKLQNRSEMGLSSNLEYKLNFYQKTIEELEQKTTELQRLWIKEQKNLLIFTQQRQEQMQVLNLNRKQILIMEQKNLGVRDRLQDILTNNESVNRAIQNLRTSITVQGENVYKKKGVKIDLGKNNELTQITNLTKLRNAETDCLQIQSNIRLIEDDKSDLSQRLTEINRQVVEWENRFKMATEAKDNMKLEVTHGGQIATMRLEVHRMSIRYGHLQRAQAHLIQDLNFSIGHRSKILTESQAREKRNTHLDTGKIRCNFKRKLDDTKNSIKQTENENARIMDQMEFMENQICTIVETFTNESVKLSDLDGKIYSLRTQVEDAKTQKFLIFEMLVMIQKKLTMYIDISKKRRPFTMYRSSNRLTLEYEKNNCTNRKLIGIIEHLMDDFPNCLHELRRILNTLKLHILFLVYKL